jgi:hypothetical protein
MVTVYKPQDRTKLLSLDEEVVTGLNYTQAPSGSGGNDENCNLERSTKPHVHTYDEY